MPDRNLELGIRNVDTRDPQPISVVHFELGEIKNHFDSNVTILREQFVLVDDMEQNGNENAAKTILRSQVVFLEGLLDYYLHEMTKYGLYKIFKGEWPKTERYTNFPVPMSEVERAIESSESKEWFFEYVNNRIGRDVFLSYDSMKDQLNLIGLPFINVMERAFPRRNQQESVEEGKRIIIDLYQRRNEIAHQLDRRHDTGIQNDITKSFVEECFSNVVAIVDAVHNLAQTK